MNNALSIRRSCCQPLAWSAARNRVYASARTPAICARVLIRTAAAARAGGAVTSFMPPRTSARGAIAARFLPLCLLFLASVGCLSTNSPQLERCQTEKKQLLSRLVDEQKRGESLTTELRTANQRLADAEKQLARVVGGAGAGRLASTTELGTSPSALPLSNTGPSRSLQLGAPRDSQFISATPRAAGASGNGNFASGADTGGGAGLASGNTTARSSGMATGSGMTGGSGTSGGATDTRGFDQLAPRNGRSESGWMPRSSGNAPNVAGGGFGASGSGSAGTANGALPR